MVIKSVIKKAILYTAVLAVPILLIACIFLWFSCGHNTSDYYSQGDLEFQKKLQEVINSDAKELRLKDITDFEWDEVCIHLPDNPDTYLVDWTIKYWYIGFYKNNALEGARHFKINRKILDLHPSLKDDPAPYHYDKDVLFKLTGRHWKFIILE